jgi:hypothetical protein
MNHPPTHTGFTRFSPAQARTVLGAFALLAAFFVAVALLAKRDWNGESHTGQGDMALFRAIVARVHAGEFYYDADFAERTARGYPLASVFNSRMPLSLWLLAVVPDHRLGKGLMVLLALAAAGTLFRAMLRDEPEHPGRAFGGLLLLTGPLLLCGLGDIYFMPVLWAGVLIALSVGLYGLERPVTAAAAGVAALLMRELAMPYVVLCAAWAWRERRPRELLVWGVGLAAWLAFFAWHCHEVVCRIPPGARAHAAGWVQWGGAAFVISTVRMNVYLLVSAPWVAALYFAAAMLGLASWNSRFGTRVGLTVSLYVAGMAVVGLPVNAYWGLVTAPLVALGAARAPVALAECWQRLRWPTRAVAH